MLSVVLYLLEKHDGQYLYVAPNPTEFDPTTSSPSLRSWSYYPRYPGCDSTQCRWASTYRGLLTILLCFTPAAAQSWPQAPFSGGWRLVPCNKFEVFTMTFLPGLRLVTNPVLTTPGWTDTEMTDGYRRANSAAYTIFANFDCLRTQI